ncbi:cytosine deaminase [Blautia sp. CAG:52]|nr:cytosine deaminase [Blautia sp. CAG:52]
MLHFIYNSAGCSSDDIPWNLSAFCSHEVCGGYCTQCDGVVVCSFIAHNTYGTHVGQSCKVLVYFFVQTGFGDFFTPDGICILYHLYFFCGYIADDTNTEPRTREWLTEYQVIRNAKFQTGFSYFVFEQVTQRLDDFLEIYMLRQTTYVVVGFDHGGFSANATFYNIRINSSLYQEVHSTDFLCFFFKYTDELFTDDFSLCFRFFHTFQFLIEPFLCVDPDKIQVIISVRSEDCFYFIAFVLSQKTMVYEYTGQLIANCFG